MMNYENAFRTIIDIEAVAALRENLLKVEFGAVVIKRTIQFDAMIRKAVDYLIYMGGFGELTSEEVNEIIPDIIESYREDIRRENYDSEDHRNLLMFSEEIGVRVINYIYGDKVDTIPYN